MKSLAAVLALSIAAAVAAPALAQSPPTQAECEKMQDKRWDDGSKTCLPKQLIFLTSFFRPRYCP